MAKKEIDENGNSFSVNAKTRYWVAVGYPENMLPDWQEKIDDAYQLPYCYCIHDKDKLAATGEEEDRKIHVHIMLAWGNTTTYKHALSTFRRLNAPGKEAFPTCEPVIHVRYMYNYLIHDTPKAKKKNKHLYDVKERVSGNNFDIGNFEQLSEADKKQMRRTLSKMILSEHISSYVLLYERVLEMEPAYEDVLCGYVSHFRELCRGMYLHSARITHSSTTTEECVMCDERQKSKN